MTKNKLIIIIVVVVLVIAIVGFVIFNNAKKNKNVVVDNEFESIKLTTVFDEETGYYYIRDNVTNEIIAASKTEEDLQFYLENPDYDPNPLAPEEIDLKTFVNYYEGVDFGENVYIAE